MRSRLLVFFFFRFLSPTGYFLSRKKVSKERFKKRGISISPFPLSSFSFCLRRVTFVSSDKSNQKRHSRGKGFRFPFPLENPPSLKRPKGEGLRPLPFGNPHPGVHAIIKSRLCRKAAKVGGGQGRHLKDDLAMRQKTTQPSISEQKRQRSEEQRQCNIWTKFAQHSVRVGKASKINDKCRRARDFQTAGLNGVFGYFCRRGQKYPAPGRGMSLLA